MLLNVVDRRAKLTDVYAAAAALHLYFILTNQLLFIYILFLLINMSCSFNSINIYWITQNKHCCYFSIQTWFHSNNHSRIIAGYIYIRVCVCVCVWCRFFYACVLVALCAFVAVDIGGDVKRLTSLGGMVIFLTLGFLTSTNPSKVSQPHCVDGSRSTGVLIYNDDAYCPHYSVFVHVYHHHPYGFLDIKLRKHNWIFNTWHITVDQTISLFSISFSPP